MTFTDNFCVLKVRFFNKSNFALSDKEYHYLIAKDILYDVLSNNILVPVNKYNYWEYVEERNIQVPTFYIENEKGYNYRDSEIVITGIDSFSRRNDLVVIKKIKKAKTVALNVKYEKYFSSSLDNALNDLLKGINILETSQDLNDVEPMGIYKTVTYPNYDAHWSTTDRLEEKVEKILADIKPFVLGDDKKTISNNKKENDNMFENVMKGLEFGVAQDVKFSIYGPAFKSTNGYIAITKDGETYDVSGMTFDEFSGLNYMCPIAADAIEEGDFVRHNYEWVRVLALNEDGTITAHKFSCNEEIVIRPVKNIFGFNFYTKLVCLGSQIMGTPDAKNPFGNMLPLMLLSDKGGMKDKMLPLMFMMNSMNTAKAEDGKQMNMGFDMSNPMFLYMMLGK